MPELMLCWGKGGAGAILGVIELGESFFGGGCGGTGSGADVGGGGGGGRDSEIRPETLLAPFIVSGLCLAGDSEFFNSIQSRGGKFGPSRCWACFGGSLQGSGTGFSWCCWWLNPWIGYDPVGGRSTGWIATSWKKSCWSIFVVYEISTKSISDIFLNFSTTFV